MPMSDRRIQEKKQEIQFFLIVLPLLITIICLYMLRKGGFSLGWNELLSYHELLVPLFQ